MAFSGGKDSLVVASLCSRAFEQVDAMFMYTVPGLRVQQAPLEAGAARFKFGAVHQYPHWAVGRFVRQAIFAWPTLATSDIDEDDWTLADVYDAARVDSGTSLIATGARRNDSLWRRRMMNTWGKEDDQIVYPIADWTKFDVMGYLRANKLPIPESSGRAATGVDLTTPSLLWLHDSHPDDFATLESYFPFIRAVVKRRQLHGA